jgi:hypothetical protein
MKSKEEIEQLAQQYIEENTGDHYVYCGYVDGYTQCQEDMVDKKYTEEDIRKAILLSATSDTDFIPDRCDEIINSLNKQDNENI